MLESEEYLQLGLIGPKVICQTNAPLTRHLLKVGLARGLLAGSQMVLLCQTLTLTPAESKAFSVDSFFFQIDKDYSHFARRCEIDLYYTEIEEIIHTFI